MSALSDALAALKTVFLLEERVTSQAKKVEKLADLVAEMDRNGRIDAAYRKLRRMKDEEQRLAAKPLRRKFRTLCIDAPWAYSGVPEKARPTYATMYASVEAPNNSCRFGSTGP